MKINNVVLCNFSSYAGQTVIDLQTTKDQNVILIGGNNGAGKTSLFTAIKLALYGPQCFRFQDKSHHYSGKIRELINRDAYLCENVRAFVELNITLPSDNREVAYCLHREWTLEDKKIVETYTVSREGKKLNEKDLDFFQNYLFTIVPPNLFDFFLFDGEEIGEFFATGHYNQYIKNAVLTLSGYDTFSTIQKFCTSFIDNETNDLEMGRLTEVLTECERKIAEHEERLSQTEKHRAELAEQMLHAQEEQQALEERFKKSGGLSSKERERLESRAVELDKIKGDKSRKIRNFVEDLMPLYIMRNVVENASKQLNNERAVRQYEMLSALLSSQSLLQIIQELPESGIRNPAAVSEAIANSLSERIKPDCELSGFTAIHDLSEEQEQSFTSVRVRLSNFSSEDIIKTCHEREEATKEYDMVMNELRESLPIDEVNVYQARLDTLAAQIGSHEEEILALDNDKLVMGETLEQLRAEQQRLRKALQLLSRNQTAYMYTERIAEIMKNMISDVARAKFKEVEELTLQMFSRIIRKDNYIQLVELDHDFNIHLFKKQTYSVGELELLAQNVGVENLEKRIGSTGKAVVMEALGFTTEAEFTTYFSKRKAKGQLSLNSSLELDLYSRIELNQLSKGEKQVFVLALYWAIIKTSNQSVPFVIDTPFARIDTEHREQISRLFFPGISHQVIVLSTDEEVVGPYYQVLEPHLSHEYKLEYDVTTGKTSIYNGYFEEVSV